jgi:hypothetical protein
MSITKEDYIKLCKETGVGCGFEEIEHMTYDAAIEYLFTCPIMGVPEDIGRIEEERKARYDAWRKTRK